MLLRKNQYQIKLQKQAPKVLRICSAIDKSFIYITTCKEPYSEQKLVHIDQKGRILWQKNYSQAIDTFGMFNERDVIILNVAKNQIDIIDLTTYEIRSYPHTYSFPDTSYMQIHTFYQTRYLCVEQSGPTGDGKLVLTYYRYASNDFQEVSQYKSKQTEWLCGYHTTKVNNHSKIAWWKDEFKDEFQFSLWDLEKNHSGALSTVKCRNTISAMLGEQTITVCVAQIWQSAPDLYMLSCHNSTNIFGIFRKNYVIDQVSGIVRESKFSPQNSLARYRSVIQCFNMGTFTIFFSENMKEGVSEPAPIYFMDNSKEELIASTQTWKATNKSHFYQPGSDPNMLVEAIHENGNVSHITVVEHKMMTINEMYLHFLLSMNEDFDDDILQDTLQLLGYI